MSHNPNNKECELSKLHSHNREKSCACTCDKKDWTEHNKQCQSPCDTHNLSCCNECYEKTGCRCESMPKQDCRERFDKAFVAKGDTQFRSTVESDEVMSFIFDLLFQARKEERERVVTEFEEWAKSLPITHERDGWIGVTVDDNKYRLIKHSDVLAFADSLKKKI